MTENELLDWENRLAEEENHSVKSCDFAEFIWSGQVSEEQQIRLLESPHMLVRQAIAWAISDWGRDGRPMRRLFEIGPTDPNPRVRVYALWDIQQSPVLSKDQKLKFLHEFSTDDDENVIGLVRTFSI